MAHSRQQSIDDDAASYTLHRLLCPYHQLVAANVALPDDNVRVRRSCDDAQRGGGGGGGARSHEMDLIRDSLNDDATRPRDGHLPAVTMTTALDACGQLSRSVGRAAHVSVTDDQLADTAHAD